MHRSAPALLLLAFLSACGGGSHQAPRTQPATIPAEPPAGDSAVFKVKPYLQMGNNPDLPDRLRLLWHSDGAVTGWSVEIRHGAQPAWIPMAAPASTLVDVPRAALGRHLVWSATLAPLTPGETFDYRVLQDGRQVFLQTGVKARPVAGQPQRVAVVGDMVHGGPAEKQVAFRIWGQHPDYVVTTGDNLYRQGTSEVYRDLFFPTYNAEAGSAAAGAPLMRGTLMVASLGDHDVDHADAGRTPRSDSMAYYYYWDQPQNGPVLPQRVPLSPAADWQGFLAAAGPRYPRMGSFSFDQGDVHWTILDSNPYVDWTSRAARDWLAADLAAARGKWRFVVFHKATFNAGSLAPSWKLGRMRVVWPLLQQHHVDLVLTGDLHCYQRSKPLAFTPKPDGVPDQAHFMNEANLLIDHAYDGTAHTRPAYPIHIITGAGGARLHGIHRPQPPRPRRPYDQELEGGRHSYSLLEITGHTVTFSQLDDKDQLIDRFVLTR